MSNIDQIKEDLQLLEDKKDKLEYVIDLGKQLEEFPKELMTEENYVKSCNSPTFIVKKPKLLGYSESMVVRGYIEIIFQAFKDKKNSKKYIKQFLNDTKLNVSMVGTRANAFISIYDFLND